MKSVASEQADHTPRTAHTEQSEIEKPISRVGNGGKEEIVNIPRESESELHQRTKKSRSEYRPVRRSSHEPTRNQQDLNFPEAGNSHPNTPISSDIVSNISVSNRSERSVAHTIEVPIETSATAVRTADVERDEAMASKKRDRPPSPETKKRTIIRKE